MTKFMKATAAYARKLRLARYRRFRKVLAEASIRDLHIKEWPKKFNRNYRRSNVY